MKNLSLSKILALLLLVSFGIQEKTQAEQPNSHWTADRQLLNTISGNLTTKQHDQISNFLKLHEKEIKPLTQLNDFVDWKKTFEDNNKNLANVGLKNIDPNNENYSFQIPNTRFIVEIAGPGNRWQNIVQHFNKMSDSDKYTYAISLGNDVDTNKALLDKMRKEIEAKYKKNPVTTYQAISRLYIGKALEDRINEKNLKNIKQPGRFLVSYPWAKMSTADEDPYGNPINSVNDDNYTVIEDQIENARHIVDKNYLAILAKNGMTAETIKKQFVDIKEVSPLLIPQILEAFKAGLWNFDALLNKDGDIYFVDIEQPNSASPALLEKGFNGKDPFWQNRINGAYQQLIGMIKVSGTPEQLEAAKKYIETDEETKKLPFYDAIKKAL